MRSLLTYSLAVLLILLVGANGAIAQTADFTISSLPVTDTYNTTGMGDDIDVACPNSSTSPDIIYEYVCTGDIDVSVSLCSDDTGFDTKLYVFANDFELTSLLACDDNGCDFGRSFIDVVELSAGQTYYFVVDGSGGEAGEYELSIDEYVEPPTYDFTFSSIPMADTYNTVGMGDDLDVACPNASTSEDVIYRYECTEDIDATISLCSDDTDFDTKLYVYANNYDPANLLACDDDGCDAGGDKGPQSYIDVVEMSAGQTYYIVVDGSNGEGGEYELTIEEFVEPPSPDYWVTTGVPYVDAGLTLGMGDNIDFACPNTSTSEDVIYAFVCSEDADVSMSLCSDDTDFDTKLYVFDNIIDPAYVIACDDDGCDAGGDKGPQSYIDMVEMSAGHTYYIVVDGSNGEAGEYEFSIDEVVEPPSPDFWVTTGVPYVDAGLTLGMGDNIDFACPNTSTSEDVIYAFVCSEDADVSISLCSDDTDFDTKLYVFDNIIDPAYVIACDDDGCDAGGDKGPQSYIDMVEMSAGHTYYIVVDGSNGEAGEYEFSIDEVVEPPSPDDWFTSVPYVTTNNTTSMGDDVDYACPNASTSPDIIYGFVCDEDVDVSISLCSDDTEFDTKLYVYDGYVDESTLLACDDDGCGDSKSYIEAVEMSEGHTYMIVVDGSNGEFGEFELSVDPLEEPPSPDDWFTSVPYVTTNNTTSMGDDVDYACPNASTSPDIIYGFVCDEDVDVSISLCSDDTEFDTKLYVYDGYVDESTLLACDDDGCGDTRSYIESVEMSEGHTYMIVVDGSNGEFGEFELSVDPLEEPPSPDDWFTSVPYVTTNNTTGMGDDVDYACPNASTSPDIIYGFVCSEDVDVSLSLCSDDTEFDTKLYVYDGYVDESTLLACDDDGCGDTRSYIESVEMSAGHTYMIVVDGSNGEFGEFEFSVAPLEEPPTPDYYITSIPYVTTDNSSTYGDDFDVACPNSSASPDVLYQYDCTSDELLNLSLCSDDTEFDTKLYVYMDGVEFGNLWACDDDGCGDTKSYIEQMSVYAGHTYYIVVDGSNNESGEYEFTVENYSGCISEVEPNGGCYDDPPTFNDLPCGTRVCGTGSFINNVKDMEFFTFTLETEKVVTIKGWAEFDWYSGIQIPFSMDPCDQDGSTAYKIVGSPDEIDSVQAQLDPGLYVVFFMHRGIGSITSGDYWIEVNCEDPQTCVPDFSVTAPGSWSGSLIGAGNDCLLSEGDDHIYEIEIPYDGRWTFTTCNSEPGWDAWMYLGSTCCDNDILYMYPQHCDGGYGDHYTIEDVVLTAGTYYIDIEPNIASNPGDYTLDVTWEPICEFGCPENATLENEPNGGCHEDGDPIYDNIACGDTICGTSWLHDDWRDADFYMFTIDSPQLVSLTGTAEFEYQIAFIVPNPLDWCRDITFFNSAISEECDTTTIYAALPPGSYLVWIGANWGTNMNFDEGNYWLALECEHLPNSVLLAEPSSLSGAASAPQADTTMMSISNEGDAVLTADISVNVLPQDIAKDLPVADLSGSAAYSPKVTDGSPFNTTGYDAEAKVISDVAAPQPDAAVMKQGGDNIADAMVVTGIPYHDVGSTVGYTNDYDEVCPYNNSTAPDVVYVYTATMDTLLSVSLCNGSDYDTKLYVYEDVAGNTVACNDDACPDYVSQIASNSNHPLEVFAGHTYYIVVDGFGTEAGNYVIDIDYDEIITCPDEISLWSAAPTFPDDPAFWTSDLEPDGHGYKVFENFSGAYGSIEEVKWWGLNLLLDEGDWVECNTDPETFEIGFYKYAVDGTPGELVRADTVTVSPVSTGVMFSDGFLQKEYHAVLPKEMYLSEGWITIQGISTGDNCWFLWQISRELTDDESLTFNGTSYGRIREDMSLCLIGTPGEPWLSVDATEIEVMPGNSTQLEVTMDASNLTEGTYNGAVVFRTNEVPARVLNLPVEFTVTACDCTPGQADNDDEGIIDIGDLTHLIAYLFLQAEAPIPYPVCSGDANCDCIVDIGDITELIKFLFLSGAPPCTCEDELNSCGAIR